MKKRIFALFMTLIMGMLVLTACANETKMSMYQLYTKASASMEKADSLLYNINGDIGMDLLGQKMNMTMTGSVAQVIRSETDIDMKVDMSTNVAGQNISVLAYYKDGVYYMDVMGEKMKMDMPIDQALEQANGNAIIDFPESAIKNESVKNVTEGKEISCTLTGSAVNDKLKEQLGALDQIANIDPSMNIAMNFGDVNLKALIDKDGNFKSYTMVFPLEMTVENETLTANYNMTMDIVQMGGVTIDFPTDLNTYQAGNMMQ